MTSSRPSNKRTAVIKNRSWQEWLVLLLALMAAAFFVTASAGQVVARIDPFAAQKFVPWDGVVAGKAAEAAFTAKISTDRTSLAARLARRAILNDPVTVEAIVVLALQSELQGRRLEAESLFSYAESLSRRELRPNLFLIEKGAAAGDLRFALHHYDTALRTSKQAPDILFPVLANALGEPLVRSQLLDLFRESSPWRAQFIAYAARNAREPGGVAAFFNEGARIGMDVPRTDQDAVINALATVGSYEAAWMQYERANPRARRNASRDPTFGRLLDEPSLFDWNSNITDGKVANFGVPGGGMDFSAPASVSGEIARQSHVLPTGNYRLTGSSQGIDQPDSLSPYWLLTCVDGRELGRVSIPNSVDKPSRFEGKFMVPGDCRLQTLSLVVRAVDSIGGVEGRILQASLEPEL